MEDKKLFRVALIGYGRMGQEYTRHILSHGKLELISIIVPERNLQKTKDHLTEISGLQGKNVEILPLEELGSKVWENALIEGIFICSPTPMHVDQITQALNAGKHVFCEKPISMKQGEIKVCYELAEKQKLVLFCGLNRRSDPYYKDVRERARRGEIGEIQQVHTIARDSPPYTKPEFLVKSGGLFHDCGTHEFDVINWITGSTPTHVFATGAKFRDLTELQFNLDYCNILLHYPKGVIGSITISRIGTNYDQRVSVFGDQGELTMNNIHKFPIYISGKQPEQTQLTFQTRYRESFKKQTAIFYEAVKEGIQLPLGKQDAINASIIADACEQAFLQKKLIPINYIEN